MAEKILARKRFGDNSDYEWLSLSPDHTVINAGGLQQLADAANGEPVILLIPAADVLHMDICLPIKSSRQLKKALPFAIEDLLAQEVENYHLAWSKQQDDHIAVAAIELHTLHRYQDDCQQAGLNLTGIYSELLCVPYQADGISLVIEQNLAILRFKQWQGGSIELPTLTLLVEKLIAEQQLPPTLNIWQTGDHQPLAWPDAFQIEQHSTATVLALLAKQLPKKQELNLLTARYQLNKSGGQHWQAWLPAAAMLLLAVSLQFGMTLQHYWHSQATLGDLEQANQQLFRDTFPHVKRIVNIKSQAQQELAALRKTAEQSDANGYLLLLYKTGEALANAAPDQNLRLQSMDFTNNILNLSLTATDVAQLDAFKKSIEQSAGIKADIRSAETGSTGVQAHIDISRPAS